MRRCLCAAAPWCEMCLQGAQGLGAVCGSGRGAREHLHLLVALHVL